MAEIDWDRGTITPPADAATDWDSGTITPPAAKGFGSDAKTALKIGVLKTPGAITGLADIPAGMAGFDRPFGRLADRAGAATGFHPSKWAEDEAQNYSDAAKAGRQEIDSTWNNPDKNALDVAGAYLRNPRTTALNVLQSAPSMLVGGAAGRGLGMVSRLSGAARGAIGEGAVMAGQQMDQIDQTVDPQRAATAALATGVGGAAMGYAGGKLAQRLGILDVDTALAGGTVAGAVRPSLAKRIPAGMVQEGLLEEAPQSALEVGAQNIAEGNPITQGMAQGVTEGALAGSVMGGVAGAIPAPTPPASPDSQLVGVIPSGADGGNATVETQLKPPATGSTGQAGSSVIGGQPAPGEGISDVLAVSAKGAADQTKAEPSIPQSNGAAEGPGEAARLADHGGSIGFAQGSSPALIPADATTAIPPVSRSQAMGIDPSAGAISAAAAVAVDSGADIITQTQAAQKAQAEADAKVKPGKDGKPGAKPEPQAPAPVMPAAADPTAPITGPFTQAVGDPNVAPSPTPASSVEGPAPAQPVDAPIDAAAAPGVGLDQGTQGAGAVPVQVPQPDPSTQVTQEISDANQAITQAQPRAQGESGNGGQRPADALDTGADAARPDAAGQPAAAQGGVATGQVRPTEPVDVGAHTAATSPLNDLPEPTEAQKLAGNYRKGALVVGGLNISIENPEGSTRSGTDPDGKAWSNTMTGHYGYVKRTTGSDGEQQDVYIKPGTPLDYAGPVFVVDQIDPKTGKHDEFKSLIGYRNGFEARRAYLSNYAPKWKGLKAITPMEFGDFKRWVQSPLKTDPKSFGKNAALDKSLPDGGRGNASLASNFSQGSAGLEKRDSGGDVPTIGPMSLVDGRDSTLGKGLVDATPTHVESGSDRHKTGAGVMHGDGLVQRPGKSPEAMKSSVLREGGDLKVVNGVVEPILVPVVDDLTGGKPPADGRLDDKPVLKLLPANSIPLDADKPVGGAVARKSADVATDESTQDRAPKTSANGTPPPAKSNGLRVGTMPTNAELVTIKDGVLFIGKYEALNFDTGEPVKIADGSNGLQIRKALADNKALGSHQKVFGATESAAQPATPAQSTPVKPQGRSTLRKAAYDRNPMLTFLATHGLFHDKERPGSQKSEFSPDKQIMVMGYGPVFKKTGLMPDLLVARAVQDGYLPADGTESQLTDLIRQAIGGKKVVPMYAEGAAETEMQHRMDERAELEEEADLEQNAESAVAAVDDLSVFDDVPALDAKSNSSTEDAMRAMGFTEQEIEDAIANEQSRAQEGRQGSGQPVQAAAGQAPGSDRAGTPAAPAEPAEGLTAPTRADVLRQQDQRDAEEQRKNDGGDKPAPAKQLTGDVPDMFNTQGSVFDGPVANEPGAEYSDRYETDLFGNPLPEPTRKAASKPAGAGVRGDVQPAGAIQDTPATVGEYFTNTIVGSQVSRELGASKVTTPEQAATATQYLYKSAVERLDGIVTDKDGNVLGVVGGFKGALAQASVYPATIVGEAVRIPGAANIWFSHNHPSGVSTLSRADENLNQTLADVFRGSGIEPKGLLAVTGDKFSFVGADKTSQMISGRQIVRSVVRKKVPVIERELGDGKPGVSISSPTHAKQVAKTFYDKAKEPGIVLMSFQNEVVAWIPIPKAMMGPLRDTGQLRAIYRAVSQANAGAAIIAHGGELSHQSIPSRYPTVTPAENIGAALQKIDVRVLDIIDAVANRSAAERGEDLSKGPLYARSPFYSALSREVGKISAKSQGNVGWAMNIAGLVKAGKVKQDEVNWTGVLDWLKMQEGKVSKEQVSQFLDANGVQVTETVLGAPVFNGTAFDDDSGSWGYADADGIMVGLGFETEGEAATAMQSDNTYAPGTKYGQYQLPGGTNYREVLLTLPVKSSADPARAEYEAWASRNGLQPNATFTEERYKRETGNDAPAPRTMTAMNADASQNFKSSHWDQPNVLAHIRVNDRTDADGKKVLFVEEIQSDWGQAGKKRGFAPSEAEEKWLVKKPGDRVASQHDTEVEAIEAMNSLARAYGETVQSLGFRVERGIDRNRPQILVPTAPFVTKTDAWLSLALKRIVKMAADGGYDRVAFVNGEQSAERYDLSKQIMNVQWHSRPVSEKGANATPPTDGTLEAWGHDGKKVISERIATDKLPDYIGKDVAQKLLDQEPAYQTGYGNDVRKLEGLDLKVGGEGMKAFYDKIVPNTLKDVLKKLGGGTVETIDIGTAVAGRVQDKDNPDYRPMQQPGFTLTDAILSKASEDLPQFSRAGGRGVPMADAKAIVAAVREALPTAPPIHILESIDKAPDALKDDIIKNGAENDVDAVFHNGEIYVFPGNIHSLERMAFVVGHHEVRHFGLRALLGPKAGPIFLAMHATNKSVRVAAAEQVERGLAKSRVLAVEEALADMPVEDLVKLNGFDKIIAALRDWLRSVASNLRRKGMAGIADAIDPKVWTDKDVAALIARAEGVSRGGSARYRTSGTAFAQGAVDQDSRFARSTITGQTARQYTPGQLRGMKNVGFQTEVPTLKERAQALWKDAGKKMAQGIVDQFAPVKALDGTAYGLLRLAKGASGAFESFLHGGKLKLSDNVYDFDETQKGGVVEKLLMPLQGEHHDWMRWIAANRAERLMGEGKENLFSAQDIADLKTLATGQTQFDYKIQNGIRAGQTTRNRAEIYRDSLVTFNAFNKNILDMAEQSGLIDGASRKLWEHEFYVPFYRVADDSDGGVRGMNIKGGVLRQQAFKQLKGGKNALNTDLLDNTLMNWAHLLDAAAKNRAAKATIEAAERLGVAAGGNQSTLAQMGSSINNKNGVVWFMDGGVKRYSLIDDPYLMTALTSLEYAGMRNPAMNAMSAFKHALTIGVTASPFFKIRNLIRDSVQVLGTGNISFNPAKNLGEGWKLTDPKSDAYFRLLAGGGTIHFGTMLEGSESKRVQALVESGVDDATILGDQNKVKQFYRRYIEPGITAYNELGNRGEAINRAALYDQLRRQGVNHADASLQARDLMDFSMQGTFTTIRFLTQTVPFLNARLQGLYKLGRAAKEDPARFSAVAGAVTLMSLALLAAYGDDEDWKKREEWDRNNFWWFKFGGTAFRIPKPFEIGAIATLAERGFELAFDKEMTVTRFRKQVMTLLGDNLSMNPVPQLIKPIVDVYANKDSFSGRPIETMSMERLRSDYRFTDRTTMTARGLSTAMNSVTGLVGAESLSPVQIDHMLRGYFGWLGAFIVGAGDVVMRPATGQPDRAQPDYWKTATGSIVSDMRDAPSRYVSQMYEQAREVEQAYGTWRALQKEGKPEEAAEFAADNQDKLSRYRRLQMIKRQESALNQRIRVIERGDMDAAAKREAIRVIQMRKDAIARTAGV